MKAKKIKVGDYVQIKNLDEMKDTTRPPRFTPKMHHLCGAIARVEWVGKMLNYHRVVLTDFSCTGDVDFNFAHWMPKPYHRCSEQPTEVKEAADLIQVVKRTNIFGELDNTITLSVDKFLELPFIGAESNATRWRYLYSESKFRRSGRFWGDSEETARFTLLSGDLKGYIFESPKDLYLWMAEEEA